MRKIQRLSHRTFFSVLLPVTCCTVLMTCPLHGMGRTKLTRKRHIVTLGKASYYANNFRGKTTASGESLNLRKFTAAHRSLPFGTSVRVINLENGKNVVVRINDRGPHMKGRIIDVSPAAAKEIGLFGNGTANVRIEAYD